MLFGATIETLVDGNSFTLESKDFLAKYNISFLNTDIVCNAQDDGFITWVSEDGEKRFVPVDSHPEAFTECKRGPHNEYPQMMGESVDLISKFLTRAGGVIGGAIIGDTTGQMSRNQTTAIVEFLQGK